LGPPTRQAIAPIEGDVVSLELLLREGILQNDNDGQPYHIFGGLRDFNMPTTLSRGVLSPNVGRPQLIRGYAGAWPGIGLLQFLLGSGEGQTDAEGYIQLPNDRGWNRRVGEITIFSFKRDVLAEVIPQLHVVDAERPAQVRLRIADLTGTQIAGLINSFGYEQARRTSVGGARLMNTLDQQLHTPPETTLAAVEQLLGARLACPLGGQYEQAALSENGGPEFWTSTAIVPKNRLLLTEVPEGYQLPLLEWFRGLSSELAVTEEAVAAHAEIDMVAE
jgi:hypothetical protein